MPTGVYKRELKGSYNKCLICGNTFYVGPYLIKHGWGLYCSKKCRGINMVGKKNHFYGKHHSNKSIERNRKTHIGKHFSIETEFKKGQNPWNKNKLYFQIQGKRHWNWCGGITTITNKIRSSLKYKQWRNKVFNRDNYTCQKCYQYSGKLHAHHLIAFNKLFNTIFEKHIFNIDNGITLCEKCHYHLHYEKI